MASAGCSGRVLIAGALLQLLVAAHVAAAAAVVPPAKAGATGAPTVRAAVLGVVDRISKQQGLRREDLDISSISTDVQVGHATVADFTVEAGGRVQDYSIASDLIWEDAPLPSLAAAESGVEQSSKEQLGLWAPQGIRSLLGTLTIAGPVELVLDRMKVLRLSMPHDVDAGELRRIQVADGAVVNIVGAREVALRWPVELGRALSKQSSASGPNQNSLLAALEHARQRAVAGKGFPVSLYVTDPSALVSVPYVGRLKVRRLSPGAIEIQPTSVSAPSASPRHPLLWPLAGLNVTAIRLSAIEKVLKDSLQLQPKDNVRVLKATASPVVLVKLQFELEKQQLADETADVQLSLGFELEGPTKVKREAAVERWEALVRWDEKTGAQVVSAQQRQPEPVAVSLSPSLLVNNHTGPHDYVLFPGNNLGLTMIT
eukprot:jgi/Chlat1/9076/Chrsp94S08361